MCNLMSLEYVGWQCPNSKAKQTAFLQFNPNHNSLGVCRRSMIEVLGDDSYFFVSQSVCPKAPY